MKKRSKPQKQAPPTTKTQPLVAVATIVKAKIAVTPKPSILDPQGKTIQQALQHLGFADVKDVRMGKYIEVTLNPALKGGVNGSQRKDVHQQIKTMCEKLLANPVTEQFHVTIEEIT